MIVGYAVGDPLLGGVIGIMCLVVGAIALVDAKLFGNEPNAKRSEPKFCEHSGIRLDP